MSLMCVMLPPKFSVHTCLLSSESCSKHATGGGAGCDRGLFGHRMICSTEQLIDASLGLTFLLIVLKLPKFSGSRPVFKNFKNL